MRLWDKSPRWFTLTKICECGILILSDQFTTIRACWRECRRVCIIAYQGCYHLPTPKMSPSSDSPSSSPSVFLYPQCLLSIKTCVFIFQRHGFLFAAAEMFSVPYTDIHEVFFIRCWDYSLLAGHQLEALC
jgi:hypothetical protein